VSNLYAANTLSRFWGAESHVAEEIWLDAARESASLLPDGAPAFELAGWPGLAEHVLGEGQFGVDHFQLSRSRRLYYQLRPLVPRGVMAAVRRAGQRPAARSFRLGWPIEDRFVRFLYAVRDRVADSQPMRPFWPADARFAFVLSHDVERAAGQGFVRRVADLDERYGFRSAFNFVPEDYTVDRALVTELHERGFEVGIHGLKHDGKLFASEAAFGDAVARIARHACALGAVGFRSPATLRNPVWMQLLDIEYDSSFFDTDPYEVMPGGTMSIWPFLCGRFVELPYTLAQDHTLVNVLGEHTPRLWIQKVDFIARWGGMALLNAHPDYLLSDGVWRVYEQFLQHMHTLRERSAYWHALPRDVARWWRTRAYAACPAN
jgi:peptidoglycan/xylan/chitin deacetylase (PgdA/CDA1 family)